MSLCTASSKLSYMISASLSTHVPTHRVHNRQINSSSQVDQVGLRHVRNSSLLRRDVLIVRVILGVCFLASGLVLVIRITKNLLLNLLVSRLVLQKLGVHLEQVCRQLDTQREPKLDSLSDS